MTIDGGDATDYADHGARWGHATAELIGTIFDSSPMRFNDDYIMMPLQAATQWDALSHVYYDDQLYNGYPASSVTSFGATRDSIDKVDQRGIVSRGVLLDVPRHRGTEFADAGDRHHAVGARGGGGGRRGSTCARATSWWCAPGGTAASTRSRATGRW